MSSYPLCLLVVLALLLVLQCCCFLLCSKICPTSLSLLEGQPLLGSGCRLWAPCYCLPIRFRLSSLTVLCPAHCNLLKFLLEHAQLLSKDPLKAFTQPVTSSKDITDKLMYFFSEKFISDFM